MAKKIIFSGIQPSGNLHLGNYIGALDQWVKLQNSNSKSDSYELIFCVVDLHAITVFQEPKVLRDKILEIAALYIACGIDPTKSHIFVQSDNLDHTYLAWVLDCVTPVGWMNRMTQFKEKSAKQKEGTTMGLYNYPALMAADILLYDTNLVPVGEDQKQHIELTRDIADRFNRTYGATFIMPEPMIDSQASRIMSLQDPTRKMSKSDNDPLGMINLLDGEDVIVKKIMRAVTDSGSDIKYGQDKPAISNLLTIYSKLSGREITDIEKSYEGRGYGDFKKDLTEVVVNVLAPIQKKYHQLQNDKTELNQALENGRDFSKSRTNVKIKAVTKAMGLGI